MRDVHVGDIVEAVRMMCLQANYRLGEDMLHALQVSLEREESPIGRHILRQLIDNAALAAEEQVPMCQDTGFPVFIVELGQDCHIVGGSLYDAIHEGVRRGYKEGFLRSSVVRDPLDRTNTGDNTPAVVHVELKPGDGLVIHMTAKGFGSENMSRLKMLQPSDGIEGVKQFVIETVRLAGPNACPPVIVGVGLGGSFEMAAYLAKKALFREVGRRHQRKEIAELEETLIHEINMLGIGPQGMGGRVTALDVHIEVFSTHLAGLPVAVNLNCHANRHQTVRL